MSKEIVECSIGEKLTIPKVKNIRTEYNCIMGNDIEYIILVDICVNIVMQIQIKIVLKLI